MGKSQELFDNKNKPINRHEQEIMKLLKEARELLRLIPRDTGDSMFLGCLTAYITMRENNK